jgi:hypothetical protein
MLRNNRQNENEFQPRNCNPFMRDLLKAVGTPERRNQRTIPAGQVVRQITHTIPVPINAGYTNIRL